MSDFSADLLAAAARLHHRRKGQKGPIKSAFVRRSISTTYYAVFHFLLNETASRLVGTDHQLRSRRRVLVRTLTHAGLMITCDKRKGVHVHASIEELFRTPGVVAGPIETPLFLKQIAATFLDAKAQREDADYNLNKPLSETDARQIRRGVKRALAAWRHAKLPADRDAKHVFALLVVSKGRLKES